MTLLLSITANSSLTSKTDSPSLFMNSLIVNTTVPDLLKLWQLSQQSPLGQLKFAWRSRRVWWFTASARTKARYVRTKLGNLWLGFTNLLSIAALAAVYGTVFRVQNFPEYSVYLGVGLVLWNSLSGAIGSAPRLFEQNRDSINNINLPPLFYALEEWAFQVQTFLQSFVMVLLGLSFLQPSLLLHCSLTLIPCTTLISATTAATVRGQRQQPARPTPTPRSSVA